MYVLSNLAQLGSHFFVSESWREKYLFIFAIIQYKKQFTWWRWGHCLDRYFAPSLSPDAHISPDSLWHFVSESTTFYPQNDLLLSFLKKEIKKTLDLYFLFYFLQELNTWFILSLLLSTRTEDQKEKKRLVCLISPVLPDRRQERSIVQLSYCPGRFSPQYL